ncbi:MAG: hypothetical protein MZV70_67580 [Desulfobacterales bacterium]|nr:hypothetical protein [Desulfobacterales bacterium]
MPALLVLSLPSSQDRTRGWGCCSSFFALLFNGMPVSYAMGLFGVFGLYFLLGGADALVHVPDDGLCIDGQRHDHGLSTLSPVRHHPRRRATSDRGYSIFPMPWCATSREGWGSRRSSSAASFPP